MFTKIIILFSLLTISLAIKCFKSDGECVKQCPGFNVTKNCYELKSQENCYACLTNEEAQKINETSTTFILITSIIVAIAILLLIGCGASFMYYYIKNKQSSQSISTWNTRDKGEFPKATIRAIPPSPSSTSQKSSSQAART